MTRPKKPRYVAIPPRVCHFKPAGIPGRYAVKKILTVDQYEALRLADYEQLDHQTAADTMGISRPTFSRLIQEARHVIATTLVDGQELLIDGGNYSFVHTQIDCQRCGSSFIMPTDNPPEYCPNCGNTALQNSARKFNRGHGRHGHGMQRNHGKNRSR